MPTTTKPELSPYDTGARCEARAWLPYGTKVRPASPAANFGKVDFDDDEGGTVAMAYVEKNPDGSYTLHVESMLDNGQLTVVQTTGE